MEFETAALLLLPSTSSILVTDVDGCF